MDQAEEDKVDKVAIAMRDALSRDEDGAAPIDWSKANPKAREKWRICARAALETMEN